MTFSSRISCLDLVTEKKTHKPHARVRVVVNLIPARNCKEKREPIFSFSQTP